MRELLMLLTESVESVLIFEISPLGAFLGLFFKLTFRLICSRVCCFLLLFLSILLIELVELVRLREESSGNYKFFDKSKGSEHIG